MQPAQLTLSPADSEAVRQLAQRTGKTETELLHEAVADLLRRATLESWQTALRRVRGMWADQPESEVPDVSALRAEWENRAQQFTDHA